MAALTREKIKSGQPGVDPKQKTLAELGISTQEASEWERLAAVTDAEFEAAMAESDAPSAIAIVKKHAANFRGAYLVTFACALAACLAQGCRVTHCVAGRSNNG